jgi:hypothetical protein
VFFLWIAKVEREQRARERAQYAEEDAVVAEGAVEAQAVEAQAVSGE